MAMTPQKLTRGTTGLHKSFERRDRIRSEYADNQMFCDEYERDVELELRGRLRRVTSTE